VGGLELQEYFGIYQDASAGRVSRRTELLRHCHHRRRDATSDELDVNGKTPLILTVAVFLLAAGWLLAVQPYSAPSPWLRYGAASERYLAAALRQDSMELVRQSVTTAPVAWALHAARVNPRALAVWSRYARPSWGLERGDTAIVYLDTSTDVCSRQPIVLRFVGGRKHTRVLQASSACFE
jgi:hypothetical protein